MSPSYLPTDTVIGPWRVIGRSGFGRSGTVYKVCSRLWPRYVVALKILDGPTARTAPDDFRAEDVLVRAQPLPGRMVRWLGSGTWNGHPWYAMEWTDPLPEDPSVPVARFIVRHIAITLAIFARKGHVHGDIKPTNIRMVDGRPVLTDFGSAVLERRLVFDPKTGRMRWIRNVLFGSLFYMAPELILQGVQPSLQSDLFSLAKSLPEICGISFPAFESFYHVATDPDPERRPHDILTWLAALDKHLDDYAKRHAVLSPKEKFLVVVRKSSRVAWIVLATTVAMWVLVVAGKFVARVRYERKAKIGLPTIPELNRRGFEFYRRGDYSNAAICFTPAFHLHDREAILMMKRIWDETAPPCGQGPQIKTSGKAHLGKGLGCATHKPTR